MKNILIIFVLSFINCKAQQQILPLETRGIPIEGAYYKDLDNELDPFQGTYIYNNGNKIFKIILKKMIKQPSDSHYEDMISGEYEYVVNGFVKISTLPNLDIMYSDQFLKHGITNKYIIKNINHRLWKCPQCNVNEKRLSAVIRDKISGRRADLLMRRTNINGQEVMQVNITNISAWIVDSNDPSTFNEPPFALPKGEFTMIKQ
ncbi:DUF6705 family protein [Chryseobacterium taihuense]|uniref:DUF6705 domain-containing protein n=1 Tax=Chryseobacterium taihuense TaxID=1141221 RepID=A0ABY0QZG2_9FLAO|nr:DUF6705 family protein [Chryseobacterium taihuense]SDM15594.1 hypothetical protein SAMN05216273_1154 [Chryseobacterium taihuense]